MKYPGVELIFDHVGHFGRFQVFIYFICAFQNMSCGIHYMGSMILVVAPEHACKPPGNVSKFVVHNTSVAKLEDVWALMSPDHKEHITAELQNGEVWDLSRCGRVRRDSPLHAANSGSEPHFPCSDGYVYDQRQWKSTVVTKWNLICDQKLFAKLIQPIFMFGVLLGAIIFGYFSDKKGRQVVLWFTSTGIFLFGILSTFTFDYYIFMIARFFLAMVTSGYLVVGFVYVTEFVGRKSRTWTSMNMNSFFVFGLIVVAFTGYFVKTWWLYQVILSSVTFPFILYCWVLPESPFWLISEGRYKEAQQLIDVMAHWNGTSRCDLCEVLSLDLSAPVGSKSAATKKPNILDLFYSWKVTSGTLTIWLVWFTVSFGFYSLSMKPIHSGDSVYINLFLVDTPSHKQKQWFRETFEHLSAIANSAEAVDAGVHLVSGWQIFRNIPAEEAPFWADVVLGFRKMTEAELKKFPQHVFGQAFTTLKCEGSAYLPWLERRLQGSGGVILTRRVEDLWELHPSFDIVVNCSGLGSRRLAGDSAVFPVRGQVLQVQAPWVKHFIRDGSGLTYIYPGAFHVTLGGTRQPGDWNLSPDAEVSRDILSRCCALEPSLHRAYDIKEQVGLRPSRPGVRLQKELLVRDGRRLPVVHHYGHGAGGFSVHWGTALEAARLVSECAQALGTPAPHSKL